MRLLTQVIQPRKLLVIWQTLQEEANSGTGKRYIIGELNKLNDEKVILRYFREEPDFQEALNKGFNGYSFFDINQEVHEQNVMSILDRRIPPRQRTDFNNFLIYHRISPELVDEISNFTLLGYTGGKLPGDGFSFVHTFKEAPIPCELTIEVAGVRYNISSLPSLETIIDHPVWFKAEPKNEFDSNAVEIIIEDGKRLGYINRAQTETFNKWLVNNNIEGFIERINGTSERPNVLLYVKVT